MKTTLQTSNHAAYSIHYHVILTIKYRHKCLTAEMLERLQTIFSNVSESWRCQLIEFGGEADHVHLLIQAHPSMNLARFVGNLKTVSSRYMRKEFAKHLSQFFWKTRFWNNAYGVVSAGGHASIDQLLQYIRDKDSPA